MRRLSIPTLLLAVALAAPISAQTSTPPRSSAQEQAQVFVSALQAISQLHQNATPDSALWANALDGLIASLDDPYAAVFTPTEVAEFEEENTGDYAGIGIQSTGLNDVVTVTGVFRGTPADRVGLQVGDVIVGVDDDDASDWDSDQISNRVRGTPGTDVEVRVTRDGYAQPLSFPITRATVHVPAVEADRMDNGLMYVVMDRVARNAARELDEVLRANADAPGFIIDLRQNPGGYLDESLMMADLFLEPGQKLASTRSRSTTELGGEDEESWDAQMMARVPDTPIVVLVDEFTASAAEILAGALQDYDRALVVGQRSFGKGLVQTVLELPYGRRLRLTTGSWYTPLGRSLHRSRDRNGRPLPENVDSLPTLFTEGGRELVAAGGIFPDLEVPNDTLTLKERELLVYSAENGVPFPLRLAEFGFGEAVALGEAGLEPQLRAEPFQQFIEQLRGEGIPDELLDDEGVRGYIAWRASINVADRMERIGAMAQFRMERDPVLAEAVALLQVAHTQPELFAAAGAERGRTTLGALNGSNGEGGGSH